jgi:hypothetical protein
MRSTQHMRPNLGLKYVVVTMNLCRFLFTLEVNTLSWIGSKTVLPRNTSLLNIQDKGMHQFACKFPRATCQSH